MAKEHKSPRELAQMIAARLNCKDVVVSVDRNPVYGWHPTVVADVDLALQYQPKAEAIAKALRVRCDLGTD